MMKKLMMVCAFLLTTSIYAQTKRDGTPDMRYNVNKGASMPPINYSTPSVQRNYPNGGQIKMQTGYMKNSGIYVAPHIKTTPDNVRWNNYKPRNR
jgi:hypothetical protein